MTAKGTKQKLKVDDDVLRDCIDRMETLALKTAIYKMCIKGFEMPNTKGIVDIMSDIQSQVIDIRDLIIYHRSGLTVSEYERLENEG